jgi:ABC-type multidrug transport system ATPase subunit/ABC-type lipoprotein release transport system permease subunit
MHEGTLIFARQPSPLRSRTTLRHLHSEDTKGCTEHWIFPIIIFLLTALLASSVGTASSQNYRVLRGRVTDAFTGLPLQGAKIHIGGWAQFGDYDWHRFDQYIYTNETGYYNITLSRGYYEYALVWADYNETPGVDYVPQVLSLGDFQHELSASQTEIVADFQLLPGATVIVTGSPEFVELGGEPPQPSFSFSTSDPRYAAYSSQTLSYYYADVRSFMGMEPGSMVVPSDMPVSLLGGGSAAGVYFVDDNDSFYFRFPQGSKTTVDISKAVMARNIASVRDGLTNTWYAAKQLSLNGIDVNAEMNDLNTSFGFLNSARASFGAGSYSQCFVNLRAAYIITDDVRTRLSNISTDVTFSPIPLSFLLILSGFGLASVLIERNAVRVGAGFLTSLLFLGFYYYISPGWRLADPLLLMASCILAAVMAIGLALVLPRLRKDVVTPSGVALTSSLTSTFSIATRNLKRRRLRSVLILISLVTLVFGFTVFTSFQITTAVASGRPTQAYPGKPPTGLMIVSPSGSSLPTSIVDALQEEPMVSSVAPKTESSPTYMEVQIISKNGYNVTIRGVMGISSEEAKMSHLDEALLSGHMLQEGENALMITAKVAELLHVSPGDKVEFTWNTAPGTSGISLTKGYMVAGVLDDQIFDQIIDLDGQPIRPYIVVDHERTYLSADSVAILSWKELLDLDIGSLTRINVQTKNEGDISTLAIQLAGKWRWFVYASVDNVVQLFYYKRDPKLSGGTEIPLLLVLVGLNVLACTLNAVYERRREIATLSLVGLNPSQISYMFLAEAGLVAFVGGVIGYLLGLGGPRLLLSLGGPGFLTEKVSWTWSVAVILMAVMVSVSASVIPALKASTIATPKLPLRWKLEYLPSSKDTWLLHIPQLVSQTELGRFFRFIEGKFEEMQLLKAIPEKMEKMDLVDESDNEKAVRKLLFAHSFAQEGSRSFKTEDELVATRSRGSSTYALDLSIRIAMLYNYEPMEVVRKTASAVRKLMLQWAAAPSAERWGQSEELVKVEDISAASGGKALLRRISFNVKRGEIVGFAGEGRRALLLAMAGLLRPSEGSVQFKGIDTFSRRDEARRMMGIFLQGMNFPEELSPRENLSFLASLEGRRDGKKDVEEILERCGLGPHADAMVSTLGPEARRRLLIAQALINRPSILLLEDPLAGLKEEEAKGIEALLRELNRWEGITMACGGEGVHELGFCDRIGVLKGGRLEMIAEGRDVKFE